MIKDIFKFKISFKEIVTNLLIDILKHFPLNWLHELDFIVRVAFHMKMEGKEGFVMWEEVPNNPERFDIPKDFGKELKK